MRIPRIYDPKLVPELGSSLTLDDFGGRSSGSLTGTVMSLRPP